MLSQIANIHGSKIPKVGEIGYLVMRHDRWGGPQYYGGRRQKFQVEHYPLCDNVRPYSLGIHTAYFRNLRTNQLVQVSGFYFSEC